MVYALDLLEKTLGSPNSVKHLSITWLTHVVYPLVSSFPSFLKMGIKAIFYAHS